MEASRMPNNQYSHDPMENQPTDLVPPMPDLPQKQLQPQTPVYVEGTVPVGASPEEEMAEIQLERASTLKFVIGKVNDFLRWFLVVLEVVLVIRFVFMLIGADPANIFAEFIYALTAIILFPFSDIVHNPSFRPNQAFEITTLIGMAIWWLIFWLLGKFFHILVSEPDVPTE
jgi:YGGT family